MQKKLHIKKGDTVIVLSGDDKGHKGRVLEIIRKTDRAIVEGVNIMKKHTKPNVANPQGGIVERESSVHISNLMLIDPKTGPTRVGRRLNEKGKLVRFSKKSGEDIK
ncbi:MAG: 50S ribosomal protein L24 [Bacteroidales bacterium]|jgi:large subunit ribosomal protein L24|nr:50S ribosomal protein L24 [Bacteroidales bacterium]